MVYDLDREQFTVKCGLDFRSPVLIDDHVYTYNYGSCSLEKRNLALELIWQVKLETSSQASFRAATPHRSGGGVLLYLGAKHVVEEGEYLGLPLKRQVDGALCSFDLETGSVRWRREFSSGLEDLFVVGDQVWVATGDRLELLDATDGNCSSAVDTGLPRAFMRNRLSNGVGLHVEGGRLYYLQLDTGDVRVYSANSLDLLAANRLPNGWTGVDHVGTDPVTGKLYFDAFLGRGGGPFYYRFGMLEIDPFRLDEPAAEEPHPEVEVRLVSATDKPDEHVLHVHVKGSDLDDAVRLGELHIHEAAYRYGYSPGPYFFDPTPSFNGEVHVRIDADQGDDARRNALLGALEERFRRFAEDDCLVYAGTDHRTPCRLILGDRSSVNEGGKAKV